MKTTTRPTVTLFVVALALATSTLLAACTAPHAPTSSGNGSGGATCEQTGVAKSAINIQLDTAGTVFGAPDVGITPGILLATASDCGDAGANCTTIGYLLPGGAGGADSGVSTTVDAPECASMNLANETASPVPCFIAAWSNPPPSTLYVNGGSVVSYFPDNNDADSVLAIVQNPCSGQGPDCNTDDDCGDAGTETCNTRSGCCQTTGVGAVLDLYPYSGGTLGAKVVGVPNCNDASPTFACWRPH